MFKKKRNLIFASCLVGLLATTTAATLALSSCKTNSSPSKPETPENPDKPSNPETPSIPDEPPYDGVIDWSDTSAVDKLITEDGLVYSDAAKTIVIAVKPELTSSTIKIPSRVKSILGYTRVVYKDSSGKLYESLPTGADASKYTKVEQLWGAFQNMKSLTTITLDSDSQLETIGQLAFLNCSSLQSIEGTPNNLKVVGNNAFANCNNLKKISLSSVAKIGDNTFSNCNNLTTIDLSNTLAIGSDAFHNCSNLSSLGSLEKLTTIGKEAFYNATKSGSNITLKFSSLISVADSAFSGATGISTIDFSNNTSLTTIVDNAFINSSITSVDFTGCSKLASIKQRAFENCTNLTLVNLPENSNTSLTEIGWNAFARCGKLTTVAPKSSNTGFVATSKLSNLGTNALANTAITSVNLSNFAISSANSSSTPLGGAFALAFIPQLSSLTLPNNIATLNAGLLYGSGLNSTSGLSLVLPNTITNIIYSSSISIPTANSDYTNTSVDVNNATPFTNSGITSIDMSKISSYQVTEASKNSVTNYLFNGNTKLKSVVLKNNTTAIGSHAFQGTTALTSITYSDSTADTNSTAGFKAMSNLTTIGSDAFNGAFSANSNATVDLSAMNITSTPTAFSSSNIANLKLPTSVTTIPANSFNNMTKLKSFNFGDLTELQQITAPNFNGTQLTSIDLSKVKNPSSLFIDQTDNNKVFTQLPKNCVVSLPNANWDFKSAFTDTSGNLVNISYPNGLPTNLYSVSNGVLTLSAANEYKTILSNLNSIDLSNDNRIFSIGPNTFFGNSNLNSITLNAKGIASGAYGDKGLFSTTQTIAGTSNNTTDVSSIYIKNNMPFGNNTKLTSLNYKGFTSSSSSSGVNDQEILFNSTDQVTWAEISKIINSLSYQASPSTNSDAAAVKANISRWTDYNVGNQITNPDIINSYVKASGSQKAHVNLQNTYADTTANLSKQLTIYSNDSSISFMHNGVSWKYTNDGTSIKLTGVANMYKLINGLITSTNKDKYLVFFNQMQYLGSNKVYYVPGVNNITVTLTVATKAK